MAAINFSATCDRFGVLGGEKSCGAGVLDQAMVDVGKVHGSLARAGKVKSQTPKVAKQEKKKKPVGRAKKRAIYNRRFVNVTTTHGKRRQLNPKSKNKI
ncbi:ribosomal protein S30-domain-containing protein [Endogone sp. FLAS-F59071]|nr:ribosomal protein S30-domain-containing protein [Endogone sp. FLAS-F59071]|eukprot:RUS20290.1 ribosomal protein S30-domain-containing protein [Endogone sp. FLAS-F59071]